MNNFRYLVIVVMPQGKLVYVPTGPGRGWSDTQDGAHRFTDRGTADYTAWAVTQHPDFRNCVTHVVTVYR